MTDLREAYPNLERFGDNPSCDGGCNCGTGSEDACYATSCTGETDSSCSTNIRCKDGSCGIYVSSGTTCCPKIESFGNVRRPRRAIRRRESFGDCGVGEIIESDGNCQLCPAGTYSDHDANECAACQTGYYSGPGTEDCFPCPTDYACPDGIKSMCPVGKYSSAGECTSCPMGTYGDAEAGGCTPCDDMSYNTKEGSTDCTPLTTLCTGTYDNKASQCSQADIPPNLCDSDSGHPTCDYYCYGGGYIKVTGQFGDGSDVGQPCTGDYPRGCWDKGGLCKIP